MTWLNPIAPGLAFTLPSWVRFSGPLSLAELFVSQTTTTYSLSQWRSLPHPWMNRLPLSCCASCLCPTSSHKKTLHSLISCLRLHWLWIFGYLCSKKRTKPQRRRLVVYPFSNIIARPFQYSVCQVRPWSSYVPLHCFQWEVFSSSFQFLVYRNQVSISNSVCMQ